MADPNRYFNPNVPFQPPAFDPRFGTVPGGNPFGTVYQPQGPPQGPSIFGANPTGSGDPFSAAVQMLVPMLGEAVRKQLGGYAFNFGGDLNVFQAKTAQEYLANLTAARSKGAAADAAGVTEVLRGIAVAIGQPVKEYKNGVAVFEDDVEGAISRMAGDAAAMLPVLAGFLPDFVDKAIPGGSITAAQSYFVNAGRFVYDPVTGTTLDADASFGTEVLEGLRARGPRATAGLRAVRQGQLFEDLTRYGLVNPGTDLRDVVGKEVVTPDEFRRVLAESGKFTPDEANREAAAVGRTPLTVEEFKKALADTGRFTRAEADAAVRRPDGTSRATEFTATDARKLQVGNVQDTIADYSKAVAAVNDIFGEYGRTNAPMPELIAGLQKLTQGGLGKLDPASLARVVRTLQGAAQLTGLGLEGITALAGAAGAAVAAGGGNRVLGAPIGVYAAATGNVFTRTPTLMNPSLEGVTRDELLGAVTGDLAAGATSPYANLLGAVVYQGKLADKDSDLAKIAAAVGRGETRVDLGQGRTFDVRTASPDDFARVAERSGLTAAGFINQLGAGNQNAAALAANPATVLLATRQAQRAEVEAMFAGVAGTVTGLQDPDKLRAVIDDAYKLVNDPRSKIASDADLLNALVKNGTIDRRQASELAPVMNFVFGQTRYKAGFAAFAALSPVFNEKAYETYKQFEERGAFQAYLASLSRGGYVAGISDTLKGFGLEGAAGGLERYARIFGFVGNDEVEAARREGLERDRKTWREGGVAPSERRQKEILDYEATLRGEAALEDVKKAFGEGVPEPEAPGGLVGLMIKAKKKLEDDAARRRNPARNAGGDGWIQDPNTGEWKLDPKKPIGAGREPGAAPGIDPEAMLKKEMEETDKAFRAVEEADAAAATGAGAEPPAGPVVIEIKGVLKIEQDREAAALNGSGSANLPPRRA